MKMTFRYFGAKSDSVTLAQIRQIPNVQGVMGTLADKAAGEVWPEDEISAYLDEVHAAGLACEVIESVNVHEDIKLGLPTRDAYIDAYCATVRNLARHGVRVIVYNFMPVFDWLRTDLARVIPTDGSNSMYYDEAALAGLGPADLVRDMLRGSNGFSLPGWEPERLAELEATLERYKSVTPDDLRAHFRYFLDGIIPTCEDCGVVMACHPDDPAWPIFGLPRIAHSQQDFDKIIALHDSPSNALCLCTGSLGTNPDNDLPAMVRHFGALQRIGCMHVRNVKILGHHRFREASHLSADGDLDMFAIMKAIYDTCPDTYIRPDHGRMVWGETGRPGYGLYDRAMGVTYLNGLWEAIDKLSRQGGDER
ncbi:MAG: mannonate dehydratase [Oscillospiraceae bacterium]|nr:mannonate dehydratase [Oscillospiraceae bacterium]